GAGMDSYGLLLREWSKSYGYHYGTLFVPCDMDNNAQRVTHGDTSLEILRGMDFNVEPLPREVNVVYDGIPRTRRFLSRCWMDADNCAAGIKCLENYKERMNKRLSTDDKQVFTGVPEKDGYDHGSDAMRYASLVFEKNLISIDSANIEPTRKSNRPQSAMVC
ncbi:MAG: hypothetical protein Q7T18_12780, partial [Sedimentisphaerales bacterium]|nr:hypothetical protein [Sedimentisphaerales bacterium]